MSKKTLSYLAESAVFALTVCLMIYFLYSVVFWKAALYAVLAVAVQYFGWTLFKFKSMIAYSCSFLPASLCVMHVVRGGYLWLAASIISLMLLVWVFDRQRSDARETTRAWVSTAVYLVTLTSTAALLV